MYINQIKINSKFFSSIRDIHYSSLINFGKRNISKGQDCYTPLSTDKNQDEKHSAKNKEIFSVNGSNNSTLNKEEEKILNHYRNPNNDYNSILPFCQKNHITLLKYTNVVENNIPSEEREKIKEQKDKAKKLEKIILEHYRNPNNGYGSIAQFCRDNNIESFRYHEIINKHISYKEREELKKQKKQADLEKRTSILTETEKMILEHFKNPNNMFGTISKFCKEHNISANQYTSAINKHIPAEEREKLKEHKKILKKQYDELKKQNPIISEADKKIIEHYRKFHNVFGAAVQFCNENNIHIQRYRYIVRKYIPKEERISLKERHQNTTAREEIILGKPVKISHSEKEKFKTYAINMKEEIMDIEGKPFASRSDLEEKEEKLNSLKDEIQAKIANYDDDLPELKILKQLISFIEKKLQQNTLKMNKFDKTKGSSSLPNVTWLEKADFQKKLFAYQKILNVSRFAHCEDFEIEEANKKLQKAYPEECVIFVDDYDVMNTNNPNEQKYILKGKFYESPNGKLVGQFGTKKKFILEFLSDEKHLYKNFIDNLISNKYKITQQ